MYACAPACARVNSTFKQETTGPCAERAQPKIVRSFWRICCVQSIPGVLYFCARVIMCICGVYVWCVYTPSCVWVHVCVYNISHPIPVYSTFLHLCNLCTRVDLAVVHAFPCCSITSYRELFLMGTVALYRVCPNRRSRVDLGFTKFCWEWFVCFVCESRFIVMNHVLSRAIDTLCSWLCSWRKHCNECDYGVATISRLLEIIGLFCERALSKRLCPAKETYNFKELTHCSHSILLFLLQVQRALFFPTSAARQPIIATSTSIPWDVSYVNVIFITAIGYCFLAAAAATQPVIATSTSTLCCIKYVIFKDVAVCCNVLQCVPSNMSYALLPSTTASSVQYVAVCCSVLQCVAVCCSVLHQICHMHYYYLLLPHLCSMLQCVAA